MGIIDVPIKNHLLLYSKNVDNLLLCTLANVKIGAQHNALWWAISVPEPPNKLLQNPLIFPSANLPVPNPKVAILSGNCPFLLFCHQPLLKVMYKSLPVSVRPSKWINCSAPIAKPELFDNFLSSSFRI